MRPKPTVTLTFTLLGLLGGCGSSPHTAARSPSGSAQTPTAAPSAPAGGGCQHVAAPTPKGPPHLPRPTLRLSSAHSYTAIMQTSCGEIDIRLDVKQSPRTASSFASLARRGFFDSLTFHRIVAGFVIQGGDPLGTGGGGPGYAVVERPPANVRYTRGVVAMAKTPTDPAGASGSQFYIVSGADAGLPPEYALLGFVVRGLDVVRRIEQVPTGGPRNETPVSPVVIQRVTISQS